jgi:lysophospholipase L1-like esterase
MRAFLVAAVILGIAAGSGDAATSTLPQVGNEHWVATWVASPQGPDPLVTNGGFEDQTVREVVHTSVGGNRIRIHLSNAFGATPLFIGSAHVAVQSAGAGTVAGSDRTLTFGGARSATIGPGAEAVSDPVAFHVRALDDLAVSIFVPGTTGFATWHWNPLRTSYVSPPGDFANATTMPVATAVDSVYWLVGVDVQAPAVTRGLVAFGDSLTEGFNSTPDSNHTWPSDLAARLAGLPGAPRLAVSAASIDGNRLLHSSVGPTGLARFDRDVLSEPGIAEVAVLEGTNDLLFPGAFAPSSETVTAADVIAGLDELVVRAHARGVEVIGCTLPPFEGATPLGVRTDWQTAEPKREAINSWIRTSGAFVAVVDFDAVLRDPAHPARLRGEFDSGDHLHPNDAGYAAMAAAVDLDSLISLG